MSIKQLIENVKGAQQRNDVLEPLIDMNERTKCPWCGKTFFFGVLGGGTKIECKCPWCKQLSRICVVI